MIKNFTVTVSFISIFALMSLAIADDIFHQNNTKVKNTVQEISLINISEMPISEIQLAFSPLIIILLYLLYKELKRKN